MLVAAESGRRALDSAFKRSACRAAAAVRTGAPAAAELRGGSVGAGGREVEGLGRDAATAWLAEAPGEADAEGPAAAGGTGARGVAVAGPAARAAAAAVEGAPEVGGDAGVPAAVTAPAGGPWPGTAGADVGPPGAAGVTWAGGVCVGAVEPVAGGEAPPGAPAGSSWPGTAATDPVPAPSRLPWSGRDTLPGDSRRGLLAGSGGCVGWARHDTRRRPRGGRGGGHRTGDDRRRTGHLPHRRHGRGGLLHARGGSGGDALLQFGGALRGAPGPLAQALQLARLREDEQREDRNPHQRDERRDRTDLRERVRKR